MLVLVNCEESQEVCKAFRALGHEAYSCDLQDCSGGHPEWHLKTNGLKILHGLAFCPHCKGILRSDRISVICEPCERMWGNTEDGYIEVKRWDLMIAHPPCTYLCVAGLHYSKKDEERMWRTKHAAEFFMKLYNAPIPKIAIENPVGCMNTSFRKPDQIIEPYMFGTSERKKTCLWLRGLPVLLATHNDKPKPIKTIIRKTGSKAGQPYNYYWRQGKSAKERSKTFPVIAKAMALQWGGLVK